MARRVPDSPLSRFSNILPCQFSELRTFNGCAYHQTLLTEQECDDRIIHIHRVQGFSCSRIDQGH